MLSSKTLLVGTDGASIVWRIRVPDSIEFIAYRRGDLAIMIRKTDGQVYRVEVVNQLSAIEAAVMVVEAADPVAFLEELRTKGMVEGAVLWMGEDPFAVEWAALVQNAVEKSVSQAVSGNNPLLELVL